RTGPEVEDDLARPELGKRCRVAAAEADRVGQADLLHLFRRVRAGTPAVGAVDGAAPGGRIERQHRELLRGTGVSRPHRLLDLTHLAFSSIHRHSSMDMVAWISWLSSTFRCFASVACAVSCRPSATPGSRTAPS